MSDTDAQTTTPPPAGFWKPRHALIGAGVLALLVMGVRSCGDDADEDKTVKDVADNTPRQAIVVQIPVSPRWPQQGLPVALPSYQAPAYGQPQVPVIQAQPAMPGRNPDNPWAVPQAPRSATTQQPAAQWGQPQRRPQPVYVQPPGSARYRPLDSSRREAPQPAAPVAPPVQRWPAAPYDRLSGSSFGNAAGGYPYPGSVPGYYGAAPYGVPGAYGGGWSAPVYPGVGIQRPWAW